MEDVLNVYEQPYDPKYPQICFDERPCFLIGDVIAPIPSRPGQPKREHYEYKKNGSCCVLLAFERHTGFRYVEILERRTMIDYANFMKNLFYKHYPAAEKIVLVQDNLNTHDAGSFYEAFEPQQAFKLAKKFEFHYTPKKGSWLNMAEIEFSALSKQCLDRRIGDKETLEREVIIWSKSRNRKRSTVNWKFNKDSARVKFSRHYPVCSN